MHGLINSTAAAWLTQTMSLLDLVHDDLELALLEEPLVEVVEHLEEEVHVLLRHVLVDHLLQLLREALQEREIQIQFKI